MVPWMRFNGSLSARRPRRPSKVAGRTAVSYARRLGFEPLEDRRLLSTITWTNRGSSGNDSDNFNAVFGANANAARLCADAAFASWSRVIQNFNNGSNVISISLSTSGVGLGGSGGVSSYIDGRPLSGSIGLAGGYDGHGGGYFLDPTPYDNSEFAGDILNAYAGDAQTGSPAAGLADFYTLVLLETSHVLGFSGPANLRIWTSGLMSNTGIDIPQGGEEWGPGAGGFNNTYWLFNGPSVKALFNGSNTNLPADAQNAVHTSGASPFGPVLYNGHYYYGFSDSDNAYLYRGRRYIPSLTDNLVFKDAYGYNINNSAAFGTFYDTLDADGTLRINMPANNGSNTISIDSAFGTIFVTLTLGSPALGADAPSIVSSFPAASVQRIRVMGGSGDDIVHIEDNGGKPTSVDGGAGNDVIDFAFTFRNLSNIAGSVSVTGGTGTDSIYAYDNNLATAQTYTITNFNFERPGWAGFVYYDDVENETLTTGTGADTVNITSTFAGQPVYINSAGGSETVNIGNSTNGVQSILANIQIQNTPNFTTVNISDLGNFTPRNVTSGTSGAFGYVAGLAPATISYKYADTSAINVSLGGGNDTLAVVDSQKPIDFFSNAGTNQVTLGNNVSGTSTIVGNVRFNAAGFASNNITVNNTAGIGRTATLALVAGQYVLSGMSGGGTITYTFNNQSLNLLGSNSGADNLSVNNVDSGYISFDGNGGFDALTVDDRVHPAPPAFATINQTGILRYMSGQFPRTYYVGYANIESFGYLAHAAATSTTITGTAPSIPAGQQTTLLLGNNADSVLVYPHDAAGNLTINSNIGIIGNGGTDTLTVQDASATAAINYLFSNPFGSGTQNIFGLGTSGLGTATIENLVVNAGTGDDTFAMNQYTSGTALTLNAGGGNDTLNFGNGNLAANITSITAFTFNGQAGFDTFNLANAASTNGFTYRRNTGTLSATSDAYVLILNESSAERVFIGAGSGSDVFRFYVVAAGTQLEVSAGAGIDVLLFGDLTTNVNSILGPVIFDTGADGGRVALIDTGSTTAKVAHLDLNSLGAYPGDTLFGPGGSLQFTTLVNQIAGFSFDAMSISLGSGADTLYAQPFATGTVYIGGGNPTTAPGDTLNLALAGTGNYVVNGTPANGNVTSTNRQTLSYTGFETGPNIDDDAPYIVTQTYDNVGLPTIRVQFSEDVSNALSVYYLELINTTTIEQVPFAYLDMSYDGSTNSAAFTFPGYTNGILPPGEYTAKIYGSLPDLFGNVMGVETPFSFTIAIPPPELPGDYNANREVDAADYVVWRKTLGTSGIPAYSGADGNGNTTIDAGDYGVWHAHFGQSLPTGAASEVSSATTSAAPVAPMDESAVGGNSMSLSVSDPNRAVGPRGTSGTEQVASQRKNPQPVLAPVSWPFAPYQRAVRGLTGVQRMFAASRRDEALVAWLSSQPITKKQFEGSGATETWASEGASDADDLHFDSVEQVFAHFTSN